MTVSNSKSDTPKREELSNPLTNLMLATGKIKATNYPDIIEQGLNFIDAHSKAYTEIMAWHEQEIAEARQDENRRSGVWWGGLVGAEKLDQGMSYMNERDAELEALRNQLRGEQNE